MSSFSGLTAVGLKRKATGEVTLVRCKKVEFEVFWDNDWKIFVAKSGDWKTLRAGIEKLKKDMVEFIAKKKNDKRQV